MTPKFKTVPDEECECGDYKSQHIDSTGYCRVCVNSKAPWDGCKEYRFFKTATRQVLA